MGNNVTVSPGYVIATITWLSKDYPRIFTLAMWITDGTGLLWEYGLLRRGYILLCHTKVINRQVTESEDMLLLFRQLYSAYP